MAQDVFRNEESIKKNCCINAPLKIIMPSDKYNTNIPATIKLKQFHFKEKVPIVAYCDFECI